MKKIDEYVLDFIDYLMIDKKYSKNTLSAYKRDLEKFKIFFENKDISKIKENDVSDYIAYLKKEFNTPRSISRNLSSLRSFYKYLMIEKEVDNSPFSDVSMPKVKKSLPVVLNSEEINKLLNLKLEDRYSYRNKALLELMYATGLRVSELINIKMNDIDMLNAILRTRGKGNKDRIIPLGEYALVAVTIYINQFRGDFLNGTTSEYLFLNNRGDKLTRQGIFKILKQVAKETGVEKDFSPHTLRHSFASHLLDAGADLRSIQELLGHEDISSTQIYTHIAKDKIKKNYDDFHPHSKKEG